MFLFMHSFSVINTEVFSFEGPVRRPIPVADKLVSSVQGQHTFDLEGFIVLPGIVDLHADGFERHLAPRRGALKDLQQGFEATHNELASNGITTAVLAKFYSWEGDMRGPGYAKQFLHNLDLFVPTVDTTLLAQLRLEIHMVDDYDEVAELCRYHKTP